MSFITHLPELFTSVLIRNAPIDPAFLLLLGFCAGITSGFYGIGGGWLVTPILNILGLPMPQAIGTSLVYIIANSVLGSLKHKKLKNVNYSLGLVLGLSSIAGVLAGKSFVSYIGKTDSADSILRLIYIIFLLIMGIYMLFEKKISFSKKNIYTNPSPPVLSITLPDKQILKLSFFKLFFIGLSVGLVSSIMGVGGGFLLLPVLIYIIKLPVKLAVGTSLFTTTITSISGGTLYILSKNVDYISLVYLIAATMIGSSIGVSATKHVDSSKLKTLFALTILSAGISVILKQLSLNTASTIFIFSIAVFSALMIIYTAYIRKNNFS